MIYVFEAFNGGSHKQLVDLLQRNYSCTVYSLPPKKWHWKMRTGGLLLSTQIEGTIPVESGDILFATSTFSLCELLSLHPELQKTHKVLYFHENQLNYPVEREEERDFQFGWIQILSCLVADEVCFNSEWNMQSFLDAIPQFVNRTPDKQPKNVRDSIQPKCRVLYYPVQLEYALPPVSLAPSDHPLHILWNHRWEHDKDPNTFFSVLIELHNASVPFFLSVLGESFDESPTIFAEAKDVLKDHIKHFGFCASKEEYYSILSNTDVCVSTALHEFFGVSVIEAAALGNHCICPNRLSYKELFPRNQLYNTRAQLKKMLKDACLRPQTIRSLDRRERAKPYTKYLWSERKRDWDALLCSGVCWRKKETPKRGIEPRSSA